MNAEELLVHDGCEGEVAEGVHAGIVKVFRVLVFALELVGEVVGEMTAFVVST
jgi:hypothetical protein